MSKINCKPKKRSNHIEVHCLLQVEILEFFENGIKTTKKLIAGFQVLYIIINHVIINNYSHYFLFYYIIIVLLNFVHSVIMVQ